MGRQMGMAEFFAMEAGDYLERLLPVGVELYAERENFGIRTSGLPQIAIQGVCFGKTLAAMSPANESFNLGMTLWHEMALAKKIPSLIWQPFVCSGSDSDSGCVRPRSAHPPR